MCPLIGRRGRSRRALHYQGHCLLRPLLGLAALAGDVDGQEWSSSALLRYLLLLLLGEMRVMDMGAPGGGSGCIPAYWIRCLQRRRRRVRAKTWQADSASHYFMYSASCDAELSMIEIPDMRTGLRCSIRRR